MILTFLKQIQFKTRKKSYSMHVHILKCYTHICFICIICIPNQFQDVKRAIFKCKEKIIVAKKECLPLAKINTKNTVRILVLESA